MSKRLYLLVSIVLLSGLGSAAQAVSIDVNNFSFEYDINGLQITENTWIGHLKGWIRQEPNDQWGYGWWHANDEWYEGYEAADGNVSIFNVTAGELDNLDDTCEIYQILEDANAVIRENHRYTLTFNALKITGPDVNDPIAYGALFYSTGEGEVNDVILASEAKTLTYPTWGEPDYVGWEEVKVVYTALTGVPDIDETLGVKLSIPYPWLPGYAAAIDNVRVEGKWASDAWNPIPADKAINVALDLATLSWSPGLWTDKHNVYFGTNFQDVSNREPSTLITSMPTDANSIAVPMTLQLGGEYFWMVVDINDDYEQLDPENMPPAGPWVGPVWSFKTNDGKAYNFRPRNKETNVPVDVVFKWNPGAAAETHDVYLSTNYDAVESRDPAVHLADSIDSNYWSASDDLDLARTYYWAVDEVNESTAGSPWLGSVMSFTVIGYRVVDDMESYETVSDLLDVWEEDDTTQAYINLNVNDVNYVRGGLNSMSYNYTNWSSPYYSEVTRMFDPPKDWTEARLESLVLYFRADALNGPNDIQRFYVILEDDDSETGIAEYDDPNDLKRFWAGWKEWNMELDDFGIDLTKVKSMTIGVGTPGNTSADAGYVHIDDIRLYPPRCVIDEVKAKGNFTIYDCYVDMYDLEILARDWLMSGIGNVTATTETEPSDANLFGHWPMDDSIASPSEKMVVLDVSGNDNHGTLFDLDNKPGDSTYKHHTDDCVEGTGALTFDGWDSYIEIPAMNTTTNTVTITAWTKQDIACNAYEGIVVSSTEYDPCDEIPGPNYTAGLQFGSDTDNYWSVNYELSYLWTGDSWEWRSGLFVPPGEWSFTALTVAPDVATLYLHDGISLKAARNYDNHEPLPWHSKFHIGNHMQHPPGMDPAKDVSHVLHGAIDDVRIYNYTLTPQEILYLTLWGQDGSQYLPLEPWRANANPGTDDPDKDDIVDLKDFAFMADNWLTEILWP